MKSARDAATKGDAEHCTADSDKTLQKGSAGVGDAVNDAARTLKIGRSPPPTGAGEDLGVVQGEVDALLQAHRVGAVGDHVVCGDHAVVRQ
ncbi:hypothetical protein AB0L05_11410 [Nonomuraea pusilla]|uniref:hypothetical protein n=1 Tax=Nonomuraea pusilla TaxID=46177 RepID=UPI0033314A82